MIKKITGILTAVALTLSAFSVPYTAAAAKAGDEIIGVHKIVIGTYNQDGSITFNPQTKSNGGASAAKLNANALNQLCGGNKEKTIIIPSGSVVHIGYCINLGSNTTVIASGATIIQDDNEKGILQNEPNALNYKSLENVTVDGGIWKNSSDKQDAHTMMRFAHGRNLTVKNATVYTNYQGHGIELIAMKDTTVDNCTVKARGKKIKSSVEEAIQIDIATPSTAPGLVRYGSKYVNDQTCKNIKITNNKIVGSRGVCANFSSTEQKYINGFHDKITITKNTIKGTSSEGLALFNVKNTTVSGNTITTYALNPDSHYSVGFNIIAKGSSKALNKCSLKINNNTVKGGKYGLQLFSSKGSKYKKLTLKKNKLYSSASKSYALYIQRSAVKKISKSKNKLYKK